MSLTDVVLVTIGAIPLVDLALSKINIFKIDSSISHRLLEPKYLAPAIMAGIAYGGIQLYKFVKDKKGRINDPWYKII